MRPRDGWRATAGVSLLLCFATPALTCATRRRGDECGRTAATDPRGSRVRRPGPRSNERRSCSSAESAVERGAYLLGLVCERRHDLAPRHRHTRGDPAGAPLAQAHDRLGFVLGKQGRTAGSDCQFAEAARLNPRSSTRSITSARPAGGRATSLVRSRRSGRGQAPARTMRKRATISGSRSKPSGSCAGDRGAPHRGPPEPFPGLAAQRGWAWRYKPSAISTAPSRISRRCSSGPAAADAQNSLGLALSQKGRGDEAVAVLRRLSQHSRLHSGEAQSGHRPDAAGPAGRRGVELRALLALDPATPRPPRTWGSR